MAKGKGTDIRPDVYINRKGEKLYSELNPTVSSYGRLGFTKLGEFKLI